MHLSSIGRPSGRAASAPPRPHQRQMPERWPDLVARIGAEIAAPLTAAIERITTLTRTGQIDDAGLRALREEVESARQAGIVGQQLARFGESLVRLSPERVQLLDLLSGVVAQRCRETQTGQPALVVEPSAPVDVLVDAPLLFTLLNATVDWALIEADADAPVSFSIETRDWPATARLVCRYAPRRGDVGLVRSAGDADEPLVWRLLEAIAGVLGVAVERKIGASATTLALEFRRAADASVAGGHSADLDDGFASSIHSQPLAGSHVLVIASRRALRTEIRDALRRMSLIVDFVNSVDEASDFCRDGLPHAVLIESIQVGERFAAFRADIARDMPGLAFIEILEEGEAFEVSGTDGATLARVGRHALADSLPYALLVELSRAG